MTTEFKIYLLLLAAGAALQIGLLTNRRTRHTKAAKSLGMIMILQYGVPLVTVLTVVVLRPFMHSDWGYGHFVRDLLLVFVCIPLLPVCMVASMIAMIASVVESRRSRK